MVGAQDSTEPRLIPIPIANASKDRVVAWIKSNQTQNKMVRLPMFAVTLSGMTMNPARRHGTGVKRRNVSMPTGGVFPDDLKVTEVRMPVPYTLNFELGIWASNQDQHYQIMEQITALFDPTLGLQTSDEIQDPTMISNIELTNIRFDENVPAGLDRRTIQTFLEFDVDAWISIPANVHHRFVESIFVRIGAVSPNAENSFDIVQELNDLDIPYQNIIDVNDIDLEGNPP